MYKQKRLDEIARNIQECDICKAGKTGKAVPGEGNPDADVMFIGEAPGKTESLTGRPFVGRSGKLLRSLINEAGFDEASVYITSPVKYLPVYVTPKKRDIEHGKVHLNEQIKIIDPEVIVLLGNVASLAVLGEKVMSSKRHGEVVEKNGRNYFITVHPAAALRFTKMKNILLSDFKKLKTVITKY